MLLQLLSRFIIEPQNPIPIICVLGRVVEYHPNRSLCDIKPCFNTHTPKCRAAASLGYLVRGGHSDIDEYREGLRLLSVASSLQETISKAECSGLSGDMFGVFTS